MPVSHQPPQHLSNSIQFRTPLMISSRPFKAEKGRARTESIRLGYLEEVVKTRALRAIHGKDCLRMCRRLFRTIWPKSSELILRRQATSMTILIKPDTESGSLKPRHWPYRSTSYLKYYPATLTLRERNSVRNTIQ